MKKVIAAIKNNLENIAMAKFAYAFAGGSVKRICFYIFHQPKMPEELKELKK